MEKHGPPEVPWEFYGLFLALVLFFDWDFFKNQGKAFSFAELRFRSQLPQNKVDVELQALVSILT